MAGILNPNPSIGFIPWYQEWARRTGLNPNPFHPGHRYNYYAAWKAGVTPVPDPFDNNRYHWDSRFKMPDHPNRYVNGEDTITGLRRR